jgi:Mrp family chromosome partitioning ATPase
MYQHTISINSLSFSGRNGKQCFADRGPYFGDYDNYPTYEVAEYVDVPVDTPTDNRIEPEGIPRFASIVKNNDALINKEVGVSEKLMARNHFALPNAHEKYDEHNFETTDHQSSVRLINSGFFSLANRCAELSTQKNKISELLNDAHKIIAKLSAIHGDKKIIGITSAVSGEGTSTLASVFATLASGMQMGHDQLEKHLQGISEPRIETSRKGSGILLIDAQLHRPSLHTNFGVKRSPGLTEIIDNMMPFQYVSRSVSPTLKLVPIGRERKASFTSSEVEKFSFLLQYAKDQFHTVFIDIPPLLESPEGISLCKLCEAVVLVVRAGKTRWHAVRDAKRLLDLSGVNVLGGVLNKRQYPIPDWLYQKI